MSTTQPRILVVDDLSDWQMTLGGLLTDEGFSVETAASTAEAIDRLETQRFAAALLDMRLDESDESNTEGLTLAQTIRQRWPSTKVIVFTGYGTPEIVERALAPDANGAHLADGFLAKTETAKLLDTLRHLLPGRTTSP
jgi:CheY-like chemotaxis protein